MQTAKQKWTSPCCISAYLRILYFKLRTFCYTGALLIGHWPDTSIDDSSSTTEVPVGEDQEQHIELTRDLATVFNKQARKPVFTIPRHIFSKSCCATDEPFLSPSHSTTSASSQSARPDSKNVKVKSRSTDTDNAHRFCAVNARQDPHDRHRFATRDHL